MSGHDQNLERQETKIAPWLSVSNAGKAIEFYQAAFGVSELYRLTDDNGNPVIAQFSFGGAEFWIQEDSGHCPPSTGAGAVRMIVTVPNPDALFGQALAAGATEIAPISEGYGWRVGRLSDPFGHQWEIGEPLGSHH